MLCEPTGSHIPIDRSFHVSPMFGTRITKIAILGLGEVGEAFAGAILRDGKVREVALSAAPQSTEEGEVSRRGAKAQSEEEK